VGLPGAPRARHGQRAGEHERDRRERPTEQQPDDEHEREHGRQEQEQAARRRPALGRAIQRDGKRDGPAPGQSRPHGRPDVARHLRRESGSGAHTTSVTGCSYQVIGPQAYAHGLHVLQQKWPTARCGTRSAVGTVGWVIEVHELTKRYGRTTAVNELTFTVRPGHVTGFLGPNGAGKTTTLRLILGLNNPTSGTATVDGRPFRDRPRGLRHVGALLDAQDVHGGRTAIAHLSALARSNCIPRRRVDEVLQDVGLASVARRRIGGFSLGMKQRLGIATALLGDPPTLLFDEPINGLDPEGVRWVRTLFRRLADEGRTVFVSSHLMSEMENTADELVVIGQGELIAAEPLADFATRGTRQYVTVRTPEASELATLLTAAGGSVRTDGDATLVVTGLRADGIAELAFHRGFVLHELTTHTASLEEAFMELTEDRADYTAGEPR
jgi:ABC-2 type transport system ATP-binding protein